MFIRLGHTHTQTMDTLKYTTTYTTIKPHSYIYYTPMKKAPAVCPPAPKRRKITDEYEERSEDDQDASDVDESGNIEGLIDNSTEVEEVQLRDNLTEKEEVEDVLKSLKPEEKLLLGQSSFVGGRRRSRRSRKATRRYVLENLRELYTKKGGAVTEEELQAILGSDSETEKQIESDEDYKGESDEDYKGGDSDEESDDDNSIGYAFGC